MRKPIIGMTYLHYPMSVGIFFKRAFKRLGCEVYSAGPFFDTLPWTNRDVKKHCDYPDAVMADTSNPLAEKVVPLFAKRPDLIVQVDAGYRIRGRFETIPNAVIATDPHAFPANYYQDSFRDADLHYMMQASYSKPMMAIGIPVRWLPYAFDPEMHYWNPHAPKTHFVTMITGLMYPERIQAKQRLEIERFSIFNESGHLFDEGTEKYNQGIIALNWSSRKDLPMRFWEGLAYHNVVLTDRCWDLPLVAEQFGIKEGEHYLAFDTVDDMAEKAKWVRDNRHAAEDIAAKGYAQVWSALCTYTERAKQILRDAGWWE